MFNKIKKLIELIIFRIKYSDVIIIGGPNFLNYICDRKPAVEGHYSQEGQDAFLLSEFLHIIKDSKFPRTFLDVGCNHPTVFNNSYYFERFCNFQVLAIDPLATFKSEWEKIRPGAEFKLCAVGESEGVVEFEEAIGEGISSMYSSVSGESSKANGFKKILRTVKVKTINQLLNEAHWDNVGIMSLDIEGYEEKALNGIDFSKIKFNIVLVENNRDNFFGDSGVRKILLDAGYKFYARFWGLDDLFVHNSIAVNFRN